MSSDPQPTRDGTELVRSLLGDAFDTLIQDVTRAQGLLREAIPSIVRNFRSLEDQVQHQAEVIASISKKLGAGHGGTGFSAGMRVIIDTFVKDLIAVSQQSMRIVERVMLMGRDVDCALRNVEEIETMAHTTRFIAINAQIEAYRTGAGNTFRVVADETKHLARDAATFSSEIREAITRCKVRLGETRGMVSTLASHDMTVALTVQDQLASTMRHVDESNAALLVTLHSLEENVQKAITALQFDDILMQLLGSIGHRLGLLRSVWLESLPATLSPEAAQSLTQAWHRHAEAITRAGPVTQRSMDAGTAELF